MMTEQLRRSEVPASGQVESRVVPGPLAAPGAVGAWAGGASWLTDRMRVLRGSGQGQRQKAGGFKGQQENTRRKRGEKREGEAVPRRNERRPMSGGRKEECCE